MARRGLGADILRLGALEASIQRRMRIVQSGTDKEDLLGKQAGNSAPQTTLVICWPLAWSEARMKTFVCVFAFLMATFGSVAASAADLGRDYGYRDYGHRDYGYRDAYVRRSVLPHGIYYGTPYRGRPPAVAWRRDYWVGPVYGYRARCCWGARPAWGGPASYGPRLSERPPWVGPRPWSARRRW
jgi:hypothetical protein